MDKVCKNCGCTEFVTFDGHHECVYCGEILEDVVIKKEAVINTIEEVTISSKDGVDKEEVSDIFLDDVTIYDNTALIEEGDEAVDELDESDAFEESIEFHNPISEQTNFLSEDLALECFKDGRLAQGYEIMDSISEMESGTYKNLTYYYIAKCFETGEGVSVDAERAKYFYALAENNELQGSELEIGEVSYLLAMMYLKGGFFAVDEVKAFKLFEVSSRFNYDKGIYNCALCYKLGKGTTKDDFKAFELFNKCAQYDCALAYFQIGKAYENGVGVTKDVNHAIVSYQIAADKGVTVAMGALGNIYYYGKDGVSDYHKMFQWYERGAELGDSNCQYNLAQCYYYGIGCVQNFSKALELLKESSNSGNKNALALEKEIQSKCLSI